MGTRAFRSLDLLRGQVYRATRLCTNRWFPTSSRTPLIPPSTRQALFTELHRSIEESATACVARILSADDLSLTYPPGGELTETERAALRTLTVSPEARAALEKLVAEACGWPVFHLFSLMDGVADPEADVGEWYGVALAAKQEGDDDMLHDEFLESYQAYRDNR